MQNNILSFVTSILGRGVPTSGDNYKFHCPMCRHRKPKLDVNIENGKWRCWVCGKGGLVLYTLLTWIRAKESHRRELTRILKSLGKFGRFGSPGGDDVETYATLPDEFIPLWEFNESYFAKAARNFLYGRGVSDDQIVQYRIGYCDEGEYQNMVVFPSYDINGQLNYLYGRNFMGGWPKFKLPNIKKRSLFYDMFINYNEPVIFCESPLDALAIRFNALPLVGKDLNKYLRYLLLVRGVKEAVICMDSDALVDAINIAGYFIDNGILLNIVKLPDGHDPSSLGHDTVWGYINSAEPFNEDSLFQFKINEHLYGAGKTNLSRSGYSYTAI